MTSPNHQGSLEVEQELGINSPVKQFISLSTASHIFAVLLFITDQILDYVLPIYLSNLFI